MPDHDSRVVLLSMSVFAAGAVALILYQHATHTAQIVAAVSSPGAAPNSVGAPSGVGGPIQNASLAGQPTPGSSGLTQVPAISPIEIGFNYGAGPNGNGGVYSTAASPYMYQQ